MAFMTNHFPSLLPVPRPSLHSSSKRRKRKSPRKRRRRRKSLPVAVQRKRKRKRNLQKRRKRKRKRRSLRLRRRKKKRRKKMRRRRVVKTNLQQNSLKSLLIRSNPCCSSSLFNQQTLHTSMKPSKEPSKSSKRLSNLSPKTTTRRARMQRAMKTKLQSIWRSKRKPWKSLKLSAKLR